MILIDSKTSLRNTNAGQKVKENEPIGTEKEEGLHHLVDRARCIEIPTCMTKLER
jgi:hypothetical protein